MLSTSESIVTLIAGTLLERKKVIQLEIPESSDCAFAIEVDSDQDIEAWNLMRDRLEITKRYPVLVCSWTSHPHSWEQEVADNNFCSRFYYQEEIFQGEHQTTAPAAIIARTLQVNLDDFLERQSIGEADLDAEIDYALAAIEEQFGLSPDKSEIQKLIQDGAIASQIDLERWLFNWELQNIHYEQAIAPLDVSYLDWFEPPRKSKVLMLLPTVNSWDALAYLHWYGACSAGSEVAISFLQRWYQRYSAELVCHYGTMLQFQVGKPPSTPVAAFELAWEQYALAPYTLQAPGISLRHHARSLLSINHWFLHERP